MSVSLNGMDHVHDMLYAFDGEKQTKSRTVLCFVSRVENIS